MTFSVKDVCSHFGVKPHTVLRWIADGSLRGVNVARSSKAKRPTWRITERAIADFETMRMSAPDIRPTRRKRQAQVIEFYK